MLVCCSGSLPYYFPLCPSPRAVFVSELYTAHYKQKVASVPLSRQTEMPLKVV